MPKPLAEIVIEEGLATAADVALAAEASDQERQPIVVALVRALGIDELAIVSAVLRHVRIDLGDVGATPDVEAVRRVARDVARRLRVVPLAVELGKGGDRTLEVGVADPTDVIALAEIEEASGCVPAPVLLPLGAVERLIEVGYGNLVTEVLKRGKGRRGKKPRRGGRGEAGDGGEAGSSTEAVTTQRMPALTSDGLPTSSSRAVGDRAGLPGSVTDLALRHQALLDLLVDRGVLSMADYEAEVDRLRGERDREG